MAGAELHSPCGNNRTSHAVDHYKRKDALAAVSFVASENIILSVCCSGIGSCTAQPPFLSGRKPVRMRHMKEKFTRKNFLLGWSSYI
jgi:hypothetical protein